MDEYKGIQLNEGYVYPNYPEWEALTQEQQSELLELANQNKSKGYGVVSASLYEAGYIDYSECRTRAIRFLTYKGAMIIPPHLVKKG